MVDIDVLIEHQKRFDAQHRGPFDWDAPIDGNNLDVLEHLLVSTMGELGECANIAKKLRRGDFGFAEAKEHLSEEIVDVLIYVLKLAYQVGVDVDVEYRRKMARNEERFRRYEREEGRSGTAAGD